jgi:hypothetical protein
MVDIGDNPLGVFAVVSLFIGHSASIATGYLAFTWGLSNRRLDQSVEGTQPNWRTRVGEGFAAFARTIATLIGGVYLACLGVKMVLANAEQIGWVLAWFR